MSPPNVNTPEWRPSGLNPSKESTTINEADVNERPQSFEQNPFLDTLEFLKKGSNVQPMTGQMYQQMSRSICHEVTLKAKSQFLTSTRVCGPAPIPPANKPMAGFQWSTSECRRETGRTQPMKKSFGIGTPGQSEAQLVTSICLYGLLFPD